MDELEIEALGEAFGLSHITDSVQLRTEIETRFAEMNPMKRAAVQMKIGRRLSELEASAPGDRFSPRTWSLAVTALMFIALAAIAAFTVASTSLRLILKVPLAALALMFLVAAWRALARIIYRIANGRDR